MDRINHVKIVTPDPAAIDHFLREVLDIPEGWSLGEVGPVSRTVQSPARDAVGNFTEEGVVAFRGGQAEENGFITGSSESRQFQVLLGDRAHIWSVAIGTRHLERAHERCLKEGIPCTPLNKVVWGEGAIHFFFAEVGGIVFEVMRVEEDPPS